MGGYKEHKIFDLLKRKSIIIKYIISITLIFIVTIMFIIQTTKEKEKLNIIYTENSDVDYKVYLKQNDFFKQRYIDIESNSINENNINICKTINSTKYTFIAVILTIVEIYLIVKLIIFIKDTKNEKAVYNMRLRKIMSNYGSYIQKLNNEYDFENYQILEIKSFEDLLEIKETINKPILMTEKTLAMETYFFIPSENNVYVYELKAGNLRKNKGKRYKTKEDNKEEIKI